MVLGKNVVMRIGSAALTVALVGSLVPAAVRPASAALQIGFRATAREPVAPGATHSWGTAVTTATGVQAVHLVEADPLSQPLRFEASLSNDRSVGLERTTDQADRKSREGHYAVAAINGDFWHGYGSAIRDAPAGVHISGGELMAAGPRGRPTFGVGSDRHAMIDATTVLAWAVPATHAPYPVARINQPRFNGLNVYTPRFGDHTGTDATGNEVVLTAMQLPLKPSGVFRGTVESVRLGAGNTRIGDGQVVLSGTGPAARWIATLALGEEIALRITITRGWERVREAIGGREFVVRDGGVKVDPPVAGDGGIHPRTAVGITAQGRVIMATVDGRQSGYSRGMGLSDLGRLMKSRGAVQAFNFDGGGSTTMAVRQPGDRYVSVANSPSDRSERRVSSSLILFSTARTGRLGILRLEPKAVTIFQGGTTSFRVIGQDAAYNPVDIDDSEIKWSVTRRMGEFDEDGILTATVPGRGTVRATIGDVVGRASLTVIEDAGPPVVTPPTVALGTGTALDGARLPVALGWDATDDASGVASVEVQRRLDGGPWEPTSTLDADASQLSVSLEQDRRYKFRVRATDGVGHVSGWSAGEWLRLSVDQETSPRITYSGDWAVQALSLAYGTGVAYARQPGSIAEFRFVGSAVAWVANLSPVRGEARIWVDGVYGGVVDLHSSVWRGRRVVFSRVLDGPGEHLIRIEVVGTEGHPRVDVDGFIVKSDPFAPAPTPFPTPLPTPTPTPVLEPTPTPPPTPTPTPTPEPTVTPTPTPTPTPSPPPEPTPTEKPTEPPPTVPPPAPRRVAPPIPGGRTPGPR